MISLFIFVGIFALLLGLAWFLFATFVPVRKEQEEIVSKWGDKQYRPASPSYVISLVSNKTKSWVLIGLGVVLLVVQSFMFYVRPGHQYYVIYPTKAKHVLTESGFTFIMPFSRIQEWQKIIDVKTVMEGESDEGIEGVMGEIPIRFIDQVTAGVRISCRFQLPADPESFMRLAEDFRHPMNLVNNTLIPTVREQVINTGYMYKAQDYISGAAADFRTTLDEQLKDGGYSIERIELRDTVYNEISNTQKDRSIREINTNYEVRKRLRGGVPIRVEHDITKNNIYVAQVIVDQVSLEDQFKKRLEQQRDISAQKRIEIQKAETAKSAQQRIIAEGERDKAAERVAQEKDQVKKLIAIETKVKEEESNRQLAEIALKTERLTAEAKKVKADADAYQNRKLVSAGLTPQERAKIDKEIAIGVAAEIAKLKLPQVYVGAGGKGQQSGILQDLLGAELAKSMLNTPKR